MSKLYVYVISVTYVKLCVVFVCVCDIFASPLFRSDNQLQLLIQLFGTRATQVLQQ